ncbi:MAG: amino acid ABC transporter substrate-binding protein [Rhodospirillaceae bacterium]|nr:amino acid ABC transporter substrate-binding protein [Rhodospirillaceae bacterium]
MRRLSFVLAAATLLTAMPAGAEPTRIGHDAPFEPFAMVENGRSTGLILDIVAEALKRSGVDFVFVPLKLDESETAVVEGKVAALAFKGDTPDRRKRLDFSQPIVVSGGALFPPAGHPPSASLKDFAGKTVVTPRRGPLAAQIAKAAPDVKVLPSTSYAESLAWVLAGKADAAALNWQAGLRMARANHPGKFALPTAPYVSVPLSFAVAKGRNGDLRAKVDAAVAAMRADGTIKAIEEKWLGR